MLLDLCDKQKIHDCLFQRGCDSYNLNHITSHLVIDQTLVITSKPATKEMRNLSYIKCSKLYLSLYIPQSLKVKNLKIAYSYIVLLDNITSIINFINNIGVLTIVGWYKISATNEKYVVNKKFQQCYHINKQQWLKHPNRQW